MNLVEEKLLISHLEHIFLSSTDEDMDEDVSRIYSRQLTMAAQLSKAPPPISSGEKTYEFRGRIFSQSGNELVPS
jgi:hypothetical protein